MCVYDNALLLQSDDLLAIAYVVVKALIAVLLWGAIATGWCQRRLTPWDYPLAAVGAVGLVMSTPVSDEIGFAAAALFGLSHFWLARRRAVPA
jgi:TRAP-type uncharacterized transport system fused permease subunit